MPKHEKKQCPRCLTEFECKTGSILLCQCSKIEMSAEQLEYSNCQYDDCLCLSCLKELRSEFNVLSHYKNIKNNLSGRF
jgi:cysteine-rich CWC protein